MLRCLYALIFFVMLTILTSSKNVCVLCIIALFVTVNSSPVQFATSHADLHACRTSVIAESLMGNEAA